MKKNKLSCSLIIAAGGSGKRMASGIPKQFLEVKETPLIIRSIRNFESIKEINNIIIAAPFDWHDYLMELLKQFNIKNNCLIVSGGEQRQHSIMNALNTGDIEKTDIILIHDAVRIFTSHNLINNIIQAAEKYGAAIPALTPKDTIKISNNDDFVLETPNRTSLKAIQTPQGFKKDILIDSYKKVNLDDVNWTDDASIVESCGYPVKIVEGEENNFKITTSLDLKLAELIACKM